MDSDSDIKMTNDSSDFDIKIITPKPTPQPHKNAKRPITKKPLHIKKATGNRRVAKKEIDIPNEELSPVRKRCKTNDKTMKLLFDDKKEMGDNEIKIELNGESGSKDNCKLDDKEQKECKLENESKINAEINSDNEIQNYNDQVISPATDFSDRILDGLKNNFGEDLSSLKDTVKLDLKIDNNRYTNKHGKHDVKRVQKDFTNSLMASGLCATKNNNKINLLDLEHQLINEVDQKYENDCAEDKNKDDNAYNLELHDKIKEEIINDGNVDGDKNSLYVTESDIKNKRINSDTEKNNLHIRSKDNTYDDRTKNEQPNSIVSVLITTEECTFSVPYSISAPLTNLYTLLFGTGSGKLYYKNMVLSKYSNLKTIKYSGDAIILKGKCAYKGISVKVNYDFDKNLVFTYYQPVTIKTVIDDTEKKIQCKIRHIRNNLGEVEKSYLISEDEVFDAFK